MYQAMLTNFVQDVEGQAIKATITPRQLFTITLIKLTRTILQVQS